jgi:hypothetical protein
VGLAIFSGIGIALYLVIFLLVAEEGVSRAPICLLWRGSVGEQWHVSADRRLLRWLALATAVVVCAVLLALAGAWLAGTHAQLAAWTVVAIGSVLVLGAFTHTTRRLVLPGVAFALAVATIAAAHADLHGGIGNRPKRSRHISAVRSSKGSTTSTVAPMYASARRAVSTAWLKSSSPIPGELAARANCASRIAGWVR